MSRAAALAGLTFAFAFSVWQFLVESDGGSAWADALWPVLRLLAYNSLTGVVLLVARPFRPFFEYAAWVYPVVLGLGLLNAATSDDALAAGLPMVVIVWPLSVIMAVVWPTLGRRRPSLP